MTTELARVCIDSDSAIIGLRECCFSSSSPQSEATDNIITIPNEI